MAALSGSGSVVVVHRRSCRRRVGTCRSGGQLRCSRKVGRNGVRSKGAVVVRRGGGEWEEEEERRRKRGRRTILACVVASADTGRTGVEVESAGKKEKKCTSWLSGHKVALASVGAVLGSAAHGVATRVADWLATGTESNGGGFFGGGGGGSGGGGEGWWWFGGEGGKRWGFDPFFAGHAAAKQKDDDESSPPPPSHVYIEDVEYVADDGQKIAFLCPRLDGGNPWEDLAERTGSRPGVYMTKSDLADDAKMIFNMEEIDEAYEGVTFKIKPTGRAPDGRSLAGKLVFTLKKKKWKPFTELDVKFGKLMEAVKDPNTGAISMPEDTCPWYFPKGKIGARMKALLGDKPMDVNDICRVTDAVSSWYTDQGYGCRILRVFGMDQGKVVVVMNDAIVDNVNLKFKDETGEDAYPAIPPKFVRQSVPFSKGALFNHADMNASMSELMALDCFKNVEPHIPYNEDSGVDVEYTLVQEPTVTVSNEFEWGFARDDKGAGRASSWRDIDWMNFVPGGNVFFCHNNIDGVGSGIEASFATSNLLKPPDDLDWQVKFKRPMIFGDNDKRLSKLVITAFTNNAISPVFSPTHLPKEERERIPAMTVCRAGMKALIEQNLRRRSKAHFGFVFQDVCNRDDDGNIVLNGASASPFQSDEGPMTTLSPSGRDQQFTAQLRVLRDTTWSQNNATLGSRDQLTVDQSLSTDNFNRFQVSCTRFMKLFEPRSEDSAPGTLVAHARYGATIGALPPYECMTLGGKNSVRGYGLGEIATSRQALELSAELRLPMPIVKKGQQMYVFIDHGNDLASGRDVKGNPNQFYNRPGSGTSYGIGAKISHARFEYARDCNNQNWLLLTAFGERY